MIMFVILDYVFCDIDGLGSISGDKSMIARNYCNLLMIVIKQLIIKNKDLTARVEALKANAGPV